MNYLKELKFNQEGLIPVITQDEKSGQILMFAWMNKEALELSIKKKQAVYYSRSRQDLWHKGEQSGYKQTIKHLFADCDGDVILLQVEQIGGISCHTGRKSCFFRLLTQNKNGRLLWMLLKTQKKFMDKHQQIGDIFAQLERVLIMRKTDTKDKSYVANLYQLGDDSILKKLEKKPLK